MIASNTFTPRWYQAESIDIGSRFLMDKKSHVTGGVIVIPTGGGRLRLALAYASLWIARQLQKTIPITRAFSRLVGRINGPLLLTIVRKHQLRDHLDYEEALRHIAYRYPDLYRGWKLHVVGGPPREEPKHDDLPLWLRDHRNQIKIDRAVNDAMTEKQIWSKRVEQPK